MGVANTGFLNPALIADAVPKPDPTATSPVSLAQAAAKVQAAQQQVALAPVQAAQAQANLENTQTQVKKAQQDLQDQQAFGAAIRDSGGDPDKLVELANQTITDPWMLTRVENMASQMKERNAATSAKQDAQTATLHGQYEAKLQAVADAINAGDTDGALKLWTPTATQAMTEKDHNGQSMVPGTLDPNTLPSAAQIQNYQTYLSGSKDYLTQLARQKEQNALAAKTAASAQVSQRQAEREDVADMYSSVSDGAGHKQFQADVQKKYPDIGGEYANLPFDPENTPKMIERMAMDLKTRVASDKNVATAAAAQTKADAYARAYGGWNGIVARANDPHLSPEDHEAAQQAMKDYVAGRTAYGAPTAQIRQQQQQQKDIENDQKQHANLDTQKQKNQALDQSYQSALRKAGVDQNTTDPDALAKDVDDPLHDGKTINAGQAIAQMRAARATGADQANQQKEIEKRRQWGDFAPKQAAPAPAAPPAAPAGGPPPARPPASPVTKTFPRSQLPAYIQKYGKPGTTPAQAEQYLTSQGYQVTNQ
jgi:hypothetical protein